MFNNAVGSLGIGINPLPPHLGKKEPHDHEAMRFLEAALVNEDAFAPKRGQQRRARELFRAAQLRGNQRCRPW